ncbi:flagellar hook-length control protein FliK [Azospirillum sp. SYSU D00513]|uniref:flagellar hook-length control protein FliK n=1 Tax=Azospirillum sp. SYSU D00513 TaxID=2812561 RepID=UPI001A97A1ED|nr:flagellar hook-length control protein FliK [Azospirillum sp. SYSU D00513]
MEIQPNSLLSSLFETGKTNAKAAVGGKDDLFATMMNRLLADSAERRLEQQRLSAQAKAKPLPERTEKTALPARAPEKSEAPRAETERRETARTDARNEASPRAEARTAAERRSDASSAADRGKPAAKASDGVAKTAQAPKTGETSKEVTGEPAPAEGTVSEEVTATDGLETAAEGDVPADAAEGEIALSGEDDVVVIEAEVTVTETTIELVSDAGAYALSLATASTSLSAETGLSEEDLRAAVEAIGAVDGVAEAESLLPSALTGETAGTVPGMMAGLQPDAGAGMAGMAGMAGGNADPELMQVLAKGAAIPAEALPTEASPEARAELTLPDDLKELAAAASDRGAGKEGRNRSEEGDAGGEGGDRSTGQQPGLAAGSAPVQAAPVPPEGLVKEAAQLRPAEAAEAPVKPTETADGHNHGAIGHLDGLREADRADAPLAATLRASRGSAAMPQGVPEQLSVHTQKNVKDGNDQFTINLRPVELGQIDIRLEFGADGRVSAMVAVEKAQTLELLQRDSRNLERALQDAGLQTDSNSLNFSLRGEGNPFQGEERRGGGRRGRGFGGGDEPAESAAAYTVTLAPDRVDIRA